MSEETTPEWVEALPEELRDLPFIKDAEDMGTFKTRVQAAAEHVGNSLRIPGPDAGEDTWTQFEEKLREKVPTLMKVDLESEEGRAELMKKLGRPDDAEGYGAEGDGAWLAEVALAAGLTKTQFESLVKGVSEKNTSRQEQLTAEQAEALDALKNEWGLSHPKKMEHIIGLAKLTKAPEAFINQLAENKVDADTLRWMDTIAGQFAEAAKFTNDRNDPDALSPIEAQAQIQELLNNPDYFAPGAIGDQLRNKMLELQKAANPSAETDIRGLYADNSMLELFGN